MFWPDRKHKTECKSETAYIPPPACKRESGLPNSPSPITAPVIQKWETHHAPRAVVPPAHLLNGRDVIEADTMLALASPSGFGLGISRLSETDPSVKEPLPLYYVSERVAEDRSPEASIRNAPGVKPGWYVIAEPGVQFELIVSPLHGEFTVPRTSPRADIIATEVWVDGTRSKPQKTIFDSKYGVVKEEQLLGFRESYLPKNNSGAVVTTYRKFAFCKTPVTEQVSRAREGPDVGSIRLCLYTASRGRKEGGTLYQPSTDLSVHSVSERDAMKKGVSVGVRRDGALKGETVHRYQFRPVNERPLNSATITIYMREHFWMQSRGLIDDNGRPVKYQRPRLVIDHIDLEAADIDEIHNHDFQAKKHVKRERDTKLEMSGPSRKRAKIERSRKRLKIEPDVVIDLG